MRADGIKAGSSSVPELRAIANEPRAANVSSGREERRHLRDAERPNSSAGMHLEPDESEPMTKATEARLLQAEARNQELEACCRQLQQRCTKREGAKLTRRRPVLLYPYMQAVRYKIAVTIILLLAVYQYALYCSKQEQVQVILQQCQRTEDSPFVVVSVVSSTRYVITQSEDRSQCVCVMGRTYRQQYFLLV